MEEYSYRGYLIEDHGHTVEILDIQDKSLVDGGLASVSHAKDYIDQLYNPVTPPLGGEGARGFA